MDRTLATLLGLAALSVAAPILGAYYGAKRSPRWAAGGAAVGIAAGAAAIKLLSPLPGAKPIVWNQG